MGEFTKDPGGHRVTDPGTGAGYIKDLGTRI